MSQHKHTAARSSNDALPYYDCVSPDVEHCVPAAHGGYRYIETCKCGARREVNANQGRIEYGPWRKEEE